ncbi:MAG TPA: ribosome silencing factor [Pararobbsia sp.]|nr:ribosome silencing factor [Pararobbsia sp.]
MDITKLQRVIIDGLEDVKAQDIKVFNTTHLTSLFDRVIVASGTSNRQTKALANSVREFVKEAGGDIISTEGEDVGEWVLVDCGDCVVHIMQPALRQYYNLEEIWGDKPVKVKLSGGSAFGGARVTADEDDEDGADAESAEAPARKTAARKSPAKKTAAAKTGAAKTAGAKSASAKSAPRKTAAATPGGAPARKAPARKTTAGTAAKTAAPRKTAARKTPRSGG